MSLQWITTAGFLATLTELVSTSTSILASGTNISYSVISGTLPNGLSLNASTGIISGTPDAVINTQRNKFVVRAKNDSRIVDRSFYLDVDGSDPPVWNTEEGYLTVGYNGERYAIDGEFISVNLSATAEVLPSGYKMRYYIADGEGTLPKGTRLTEDGRIYGFINENLVFDGNGSPDGGYDDEAYDGYSYDHGIETLNVPVNSVPKIFRFWVTATDGVSTARRMFKIAVVAADMFRTDNTLLSLGFELFTIDNIPSSVGYIQPIQFLKGTELGIVRANNNEIIDVTGYDAEPYRGPVEYTLTPGVDELTQLPLGLTLDSTSGYIHGYIPYQPAYTKHYTLTINAKKTDSSTGKVTTSTNTFTLAVKGEVESAIEWVTGSDLGSIYTGELSELAVTARQVNSDFSIKYNLVNGELPLGLTLERDGSISGRADYNSTGSYTFSVMASDAYELSSIERTFQLSVDAYNNKKYTQIYTRPFLSRDKRNIYQDFITDDFIFDPNLMYRYFDPNFGVQPTIKMMLEFGIEQLNLGEIVPALKENFYRRKLYFGDVKIAVAKDSQGNSIYEIVYVDAVDNLVNDAGVSVNHVVYANNDIYYPASIDNMRRQLSLLTLPDYSLIDINEYYLPKFMRTPQADEYRSSGYMRVIPLCYTLPGLGKKVVSRIKLSGFDFKQFDFEIDRIIVQDSLDNNSAKYLIFERQSISRNSEVLGDTLADELCLIYPDGFELPLPDEGDCVERE